MKSPSTGDRMPSPFTCTGIGAVNPQTAVMPANPMKIPPATALGELRTAVVEIFFDTLFCSLLSMPGDGLRMAAKPVVGTLTVIYFSATL